MPFSKPLAYPVTTKTNLSNPMPNRSPTFKIKATSAESILESEGSAFRLILNQAAQTYQQIHHYRCILIQKERLSTRQHHQSFSEQHIDLTVKTQPIALFMKFIAPASEAGQEVCFNPSIYPDSIRVRGNGFKSKLGYLTISLNDPRVLRKSKHSLREAGIGKLIEKLDEIEKSLDRKHFRVVLNQSIWTNQQPYQIDIYPYPVPENTPFDRYVLNFDENHFLPILMEKYTTKVVQGKVINNLEESFYYKDLEINRPVPDELFRK